MDEKQREVLLALCGLLSTIGSANDAEDHGYRDDAVRMRQESVETMQGLLAENVFLGALIPTLEEELNSGHIFNFGWANLRHTVEEVLKPAGKVSG